MYNINILNYYLYRIYLPVNEYLYTNESGVSRLQTIGY